MTKKLFHRSMVNSLVKTGIRDAVFPIAVVTIMTVLTGCAAVPKPAAGFAAAGEIHPSQNQNWCLSTTTSPEAGDKLFIAKCGEFGTRQKWDAERITQRYAPDIGFITLLGTTLVVSNDGYLTVLADTQNTRSQWAGLIFVPRDLAGTTAWDVQIPWFSHRPLSTATKVKPDAHFGVFWYIGNDNNWIFPPWATVEIPAPISSRIKDAG